jgi:hypothetical protein
MVNRLFFCLRFGDDPDEGLETETAVLFILRFSAIGNFAAIIAVDFLTMPVKDYCTLLIKSTAFLKLD